MKINVPLGHHSALYINHQLKYVDELEFGNQSSLESMFCIESEGRSLICWYIFISWHCIPTILSCQAIAPEKCLSQWLAVVRREIKPCFGHSFHSAWSLDLRYFISTNSTLRLGSCVTKEVQVNFHSFYLQSVTNDKVDTFKRVVSLLYSLSCSTL